MTVRLIILCVIGIAVNTYAQPDVSGVVKLPEGWENRIYLSVVHNYREMDEVHEEHIIAEAIVDSIGGFTFDKGLFTEKELIYRLHVTPESNEKEAYIADLSDKGFGKNLVVFSARSNCPVTIVPKANLIFGEVESCSPDANTWVDLSAVYGLHIAQVFSLDEAAAEHLVYKFHDDLLDRVEGKGVMAKLMACSFIIRNDMHLSSDYLSSYEKHEAFVKAVLEDLKKTHPEYHDRLEKEIAVVDFQLKGNSEESLWLLIKVLSFVFLAALIALFVLFRKLKKYMGNTFSNGIALTGQEQKIKQLILNGKSNKEIAQELFISLSTVKTHINALYKKEAVSSRKDLLKKNSTGD